MTEYEYYIWLSHIEDMWHGKMNKLFGFFETAKDIYEASPKLLKATNVLKNLDIEKIVIAKKEFNFKEALSYMGKYNIKFTHYGAKDFPKRLINIPDHPYVLYYRGELPSDEIPAIGMVGARNYSEYGKIVAPKLAGELAAYGINIISGLARGIDAASHRGCITGGGKTYAVCGCGVDICYPKENIELFKHIIDNGGILSEYAPKSEPLAYRFPLRNRIISGLSDGVIMVEAKQKSGSFITIDHALTQGKTVYALPGRISDPLSVGCNRLILEGAIPLIEAKQVANELGVYEQIENKKNNIGLEKEFEVMYSCLDLSPSSIEEIVYKSKMGIEEVYEKLTILQFKGLVEETSKGQYVKCTILDS